MHEYVATLNQASDDQERANWQYGLKEAGRLLGLLRQSPTEWLRGGGDGANIEERIAARTLARKERRFADSDHIRDELAAEGILLEDGPGGTTWRRA
jgi:cysteinyl-tRNA synthetase